MCGIAGVYCGKSPESHREHVEAIVGDQHARGPDFRAVVDHLGRDARIALGHNRLAIIDLSATGNQPMWDMSSTLCVVFNGEIYNYLEIKAELQELGHSFSSTSDTEVILESFRRWGTSVFERFNGMYAFALFDSRDESLYLVRDRFGVKPLYYSMRSRALYFASTGRKIARILGLSPDLEYLARGVRYGLWEQGQASPYTGLQALRPGHWMRVCVGPSGELTSYSQPYYDFADRVADLTDSLACVSIQDAAESVAELLTDATRIRLRADVPVGVSLSGGLDSSTVTAIAAVEPVNQLRGFTFGDPRTSLSEGPIASCFGDAVGVDVTYVWPGIRRICELFEKTLRAQEGPFFGGSIVAQYAVFCEAQTAGFKVLLGGQGGDEAFMGYHKFQVFWLRRLLNQRRYYRALEFAFTLLPTFFAERQLWAQSWSHRNRYLRRAGLQTALKLPDSKMTIGYAPSEPLRNRQITDVVSASLPTLLRYEDGNSMGNSIESRLPFLDYRIMEYGVALPEALKLRGGRGKWIVRHAMSGRLPDDIRTARFKRGFDIQQNGWIDGGLGAHIRTLMRELSGEINDLLAKDAKLCQVFSDEQLKLRPTAFAEATTLLWLATALRA